MVAVIIFIVAVIIVALSLLFYLIIHSIKAVSPTYHCISSPGYLCSGVILSTNGTLNLSFGQQIGLTVYHLELACTATTMSNGLPKPLSAFQNITTSLQNGNITAVSDLPCYDTNGTLLGMQTSGTTFMGFLLLNYTNSSAIPSNTNPWRTVKVATLTLKVT